MQKYNLFQNYQNIFSKKIVPSVELAVNQHCLQRKNFAATPSVATQTAAHRPENTKKSAPDGQKRQKRDKNAHNSL